MQEYYIFTQNKTWLIYIYSYFWFHLYLFIYLYLFDIFFLFTSFKVQKITSASYFCFEALFKIHLNHDWKCMCIANSYYINASVNSDHCVGYIIPKQNFRCRESYKLVYFFLPKKNKKLQIRTWSEMQSILMCTLFHHRFS